MSLDLDAIKARLAKACPGPWKGGTLRDPLSGDCLMFMREDDPRVCAAVLFSRYTDNDTAAMLLHSRADMDAMVAEIEYLRGENDRLAQTSADLCVVCGWRFFVPGEGCQGCLVEQLRKDTKRYVAEERAAVVAFLRETLATSETAHASDDLDYAIDIIERREHRREEER